MTNLMSGGTSMTANFNPAQFTDSEIGGPEHANSSVYHEREMTEDDYLRPGLVIGLAPYQGSMRARVHRAAHLGAMARVFGPEASPQSSASAKVIERKDDPAGPRLRPCPRSQVV